MLSSSSKHDHESKISKEKKENERKKQILILIYKHLISIGLCESAYKLNEESNLSLNTYEVADNIDLNMILIDYEAYFEMRFDKKPKIVSISSNTKNVPLPIIKDKKKNIVKENINKDNKDNKDKNKEDKSKFDLKINIQNLNSIGNNTFTTNIPIQIPDFISRKESILLKPLPESFLNDDLKDLASLIKQEIILDDQKITFENIIGISNAKNIINEALLLPVKHPDLFNDILDPWKGILLFGPPGTGKTMLAKAVSSQMPSTFFNISASTIISKWRGDSEKIIKVLFDMARHYQPSTIFLDEIDSIMSQRSSGKDEHDASRRMKTELLIQLDGLSKKENERVFLLAASNLPWDLDMALLRRLEKRVFIGYPNEEDIGKMLNIHIPTTKRKEFDISKYAKRLVGYSGSDIKSLCKEALMSVVRRIINIREGKVKGKVKSKVENEEVVSEDDMEKAIEKIKPSSIFSEEKYVKWMDQFGSS